MEKNYLNCKYLTNYRDFFCSFLYISFSITPGPSKLEKVVDPGSGPRVHYLNFDFFVEI